MAGVDSVVNQAPCLPKDSMDGFGYDLLRDPFHVQNQEEIE